MPVVIDQAGYMSTATWVQNARNGGGTYDPEGYGYPFRIVLHTIEGSANPGMIAGHQFPPHLWYNPATRVIYQTVPLGRSAFALYQAADAPHYTNRARAIQVEIVGFAAETGSWPQQWLDNITEDIIVPICRWVASVGASIDLRQAPAPGVDAMSARVDAPQRMTAAGWAAFNGLCSHRHVPMGDDHWDTGQLDTPRIAAHAALIIAGQLEVMPGRTVPEEDDDDMPIIAVLKQPGDPQDGSMWAVDGLFKRKLSSYAEYEQMLSWNLVRKQPSGAGWVEMNLEQLRRFATVDEWSFAGIPGQVSAALGPQLAALPQPMAAAVAQQVSVAVSHAVGDQLTHSLNDLPQRLAIAIASAFQTPPAQVPPPPVPVG